MTQEDLFLTPTEVELLAEPEVLDAEPLEPVVEAVEAVSAPEALDPVLTTTPTPIPAVDPSPALQAIAQLDAQRDDLAAKYEAGELSFTDYRKQERVLERHQREAEAVIYQAQVQAQMRQEHSQRDWSAAVSDFRKDPANAVFESPVTLPLMEAALSAVRAQTPGIAATAQLQAAKTMVQGQMRQLLGMDALPVAATPRTKPQIPPSLGGIPVAEPNESNIEFIHLDKMTGLQLEKAIAKMSADQRERWLNAA